MANLTRKLSVFSDGSIKINPAVIATRLVDFPLSDAGNTTSTFCIAQCYQVPAGGPTRPGLSYGAGMSHRIYIGKTEMDLILRLNEMRDWSDPKAAWMCSDWNGGLTPRLYSFFDGEGNQNATGLNWPVMYFPSGYPYINQAIVLDRKFGLARPKGIPKAVNYDDIQIGDPRVMLATCYWRRGDSLTYGLAPITYPGVGVLQKKIWIPFFDVGSNWMWKTKGGEEAWFEERWLS